MAKHSGSKNFLLFSVLVVATCGLIYELIAGTLASYLLGDSVTQFSLIIGIYLFSMGIGSWFSKFFNRNLLLWFIYIEILVGLTGGFSSSILFILFEYVSSFRLVLFTLVSLTGILVGLEIPLIMRVLKDELKFEELVSRVFTYDYIGALFASLIFPLIMVPFLGILRTSFLFGILNIAVALALCIKVANKGYWTIVLRRFGFVSLLILLAGFVLSDKILGYSETMAYNEPVIFARSSPYQRIVLTRNKRELRLYLNGNLQFSSADEYRYHEALVHPALLQFNTPVEVLVLGGGDGLALREILKYQVVKKVTLVDLDKEVTRLFSTNSLLKEINKNSFADKRVEVINTDAYQWLLHNQTKYQVVIIDFPDPSNYSVGKLYTQSFYKTLKNSIGPESIAVIQSTSPLVAPKSFWCVDETVRSVGLKTLAYHTYVPSFGDWGFIMASMHQPAMPETDSTMKFKFITTQTMQSMTDFPDDMKPCSPGINKLNNQLLVHFFEKEWSVYQ